MQNEAKEGVSKRPITARDRQADHWIGIGEQVLQLFQEALVLHQCTVDVVQLRHTDGSRFAHVRVLIFQTFAQRFAQVLGDLVHANATHCPYCERADQRVRVLAVLKICEKRSVSITFLLR